MKAMVFHEHGGPEKLLYQDVEQPHAGPLEAVVRVKAAAMNHLDIWLRNGLPNRKIPLPHISGCEGAGTVEEVGAGVTQFRAGDPVVVTPGWSCGHCEYCLKHQDSSCLQYEMIGVQRNGCFAEYVSAPAQNLYPLPGNLRYEEAASIPLVFQTAWHMLVSRAGIAPGDDVLIHAAGSGVGIAGIQVAKLFGARVFATASTAEKLEKARSLGADILINYKQQDFLQEVQNITGKRGMDIVFEHIGADTWEKSLLSLARGGRLVTCGATSGSEVQVDLRYVFSRQLSILGSYMGSRLDLHQVFRFVQEGKLKPVIDSVFQLADLGKAEKKMEDRNVFGKIIIQP
jgi:NADPH:quinone reductase-like Zn-dependent oxidoreductase